MRGQGDETGLGKTLKWARNSLSEPRTEVPQMVAGTIQPTQRLDLKLEQPEGHT